MENQAKAQPVKPAEQVAEQERRCKRGRTKSGKCRK